MSKPGTAPCGHPGTYVTANFITCNQRCGFGDTKTTTGASVRREPGHVDMCACAPCQIRRRSERIVLRTKEGDKISLTWDGIKNRVSWTPARAFKVRHWDMIDSSGDVVATGSAFMDLVGGRTAHLDIQLFMDAVDKVTLAISQEAPPESMSPSEWLEARKSWAQGVREHQLKCADTKELGWRVMSADQILDDLNKSFKKAMGESVDLSDGSLFGHMMRMCAEASAAAMEHMERQLFEMVPQ